MKKILFLSMVFLNLNSQSDEILNSSIKSKLDEFSQVAYSTKQTIYNTYFLARECIKNKIPGDFIECGVAAGAQIAVMAYACQQFESRKYVHLFDSFQGIPLAGPNDDEQPGIGKITHATDVKNLNDLLISSHISVCSMDNVKSNMKQWGIDSRYLIYHKGWFQHTLPIDAPKIDKICLLRLDGDLYESTKVCLEYLYPKISNGGYIVIDDYGLVGCRKAVTEYLEKNNLTPEIKTVLGGQGPVYWQVKTNS